MKVKNSVVLRRNLHFSISSTWWRQDLGSGGTVTYILICRMLNRSYTYTHTHTFLSHKVNVSALELRGWSEQFLVYFVLQCRAIKTGAMSIKSRNFK